MSSILGRNKRKRGADEELWLFAFKIVSTTTLFFVTAIGLDLYKFFH